MKKNSAKKPPRKKFKRRGRHYVYIVECADGTYYTGYTPRIRRRVKLHNAGRGAKYTRDRRPVRLLWSKKYKYFKLAFLEEKRIKRLSRVKKEDLIRCRKGRLNRKVLRAK